MERRSFGEVLTPPGGSNRTVIPAYLNGLGPNPGMLAQFVTIREF